MLHTLIVVRAKKDKDAVEHVLEKYYKDWKGQVQVCTLGGIRDIDKIIDMVREYSKERKYVILLLGREDVRKKQQDIINELDFPNVGISILRTAQVRNMRPLEIAVNIEKAKSSIRLRIYWIGKLNSYSIGTSRHIGGSNIHKIGIPPHPLYDIYFVIGKLHSDIFRKLTRLELPDTFIVVKRVHDEHDIIIGKDRIVEVVIPENDDPYVRKYFRLNVNKLRIDIKSTVQLSSTSLKIHESICMKILREVVERYDPDRIIVPWSGGKDSTAVLLLTLRTFKKDYVVPIFVDTGLELDLNYIYVKYVSKLLNIDTIVEYAGIDKAIESRELPTHENRWCTKMKINALYRAISKVSDKPLIVVGDRDNESLLRLKRPFIRTHGKYMQVAPIKYWSSIMVQLYLLMNRVPLNPLYMIGFYRIGCYICPAYRVWELNIAQRYFEELCESVSFESLLREQFYLVY